MHLHNKKSSQASFALTNTVKTKFPKNSGLYVLPRDARPDRHSKEEQLATRTYRQVLHYPLPSEAVGGGKKRKVSLVGLLIPYWRPFTLGIMAVLLQALTDLLQPWPLKIVVDLVGDKPMPAWMG